MTEFDYTEQPADQGTAGSGTSGQTRDGALPPLSPAGEAGVKFVPGGFWVRFVATIIDGLIINFVTLPLGVLFGLVPNVLSAFVDESLGGILIVVSTAINYIVSIAAATLYYGLFYKKKGATPGKMVFGLRVVDSETGNFIGIGRTFLREFIGKILSMLILMIGYIMAGFRGDKKALHDLIFGTQVLQKIKT
ncbi:MAG: RDD family protein [Deltaproteobacteria bacterium]|nr:RDD family protein [Deltaproteobacteria bacterium]